MKMTTVYVLALMIFGTYLTATELETLKARYQKSIEKEISPLRKKYIKDLEKLKKSLGGKGKLEEAILVADEIKAVQNNAKRRDDLILGQWEIVDKTTPHNNSHITFKKNGQCVVSWKNTLIISWSNATEKSFNIHLSTMKVLIVSIKKKEQTISWTYKGKISTFKRVKK